MKSGRLYSLVTKHWPRIAVGLVVVIGLVELVVGGLTADSGLEFYLLAWAGATGGLWFLFEKGEVALPDDVRRQVGAHIVARVSASRFHAIPEHFADLFDRIFGDRHYSWRCFRASSIASMATTGGLFLTLVALSRFGVVSDGGSLGGLLRSGLVAPVALGIVVSNVVPDFASLLITRRILNSMRIEGVTGRLLLRDFVLSLGVGSLWVFAVLQIVGGSVDFGRMPGELFFLYFVLAIAGLLATLFTSVWLWLYAAAVPLSRVLVAMNDGVGFLLRVTDVENQPFRSLGFVSVLIVSGLFAVGLPFVFL